jgi:hypothetical protein
LRAVHGKRPLAEDVLAGVQSGHDSGVVGGDADRDHYELDIWVDGEILGLAVGLGGGWEAVGCNGGSGRVDG